MHTKRLTHVIFIVIVSTAVSFSQNKSLTKNKAEDPNEILQYEFVRR
jgi:hypothetical protein